MYEKMVQERQRIARKIEELQRKIRSYPEGKLICAGNGKYVKWYISYGNNRTYIKKKDRTLAEKMAAKKYLTAVLIELDAEKKAIESYLKHHRTETSHLLETPGYQELLVPFFKSFEQSAWEWMNEPYEKNEAFPTALIHQTVVGIKVRSKSESMIVKVLAEHGIAFRYEWRLDFGEGSAYPDFTIMHPVTGKLYYWEHFGMMNKREYRNRAVNKIQNYSYNGIIPGIQLIMTFETEDAPLTYEKIEWIIKMYFE